MVDLVEIETGVVDSSQVQLDSVVPRVSAPILHSPSRDADPLETLDVLEAFGDSSAADDRELAALLRWPGSLTIGVPAMLLTAIAGIAVALWTQEVASALFAGAMVVAAALVRNASDRATFSFGEGFVGYRSDMGWPRGVQEDDDFHWNWRHGAPDASR